MENKPPFPAVRLTRPSSTMHPFPPSKSSPAKRDTTRILSPHLNHAQAPFQDVFNTGLLTPQASQTALDSDAAKSLISPPPEDSARAGTSRQSVRLSLPNPWSHLPTDVDISPNPHGPELVLNQPRVYVMSQTPAAHLSANVLHFRHLLYTKSMCPVGFIGRQKKVTVLNLASRRVDHALNRT
jgi:hypothetical protein